MLLNLDDTNSILLNVGSGEGVSVRNIIKMIGQTVGYEPEWSVDAEKFSGISYNVLDISLLQSLIAWKPKYSIERGIKESWRQKRGRFA